MTGALVSGRDGVAVFEDGKRLWCVRQRPLAPEPISRGLLRHLFEDVSDASYHPEATLESTSQLLEKACGAERALHLALISMDGRSSGETRDLAEDALEEFLEDADVAEFLENRLFSKPLPADAFWIDEAAPSGSAIYVKVGRLKRSVLNAQDGIERVRRAWDALPEDLFGEPEDRTRFECVLVETGAFRRLTLATSETVDRYSKGNTQVWILSNSCYRPFTNFRNILMEWTGAILQAPRDGTRLIREERADHEAKVSKALKQEAFQNVSNRKDAILEQLRKRNLQRVEQLVEELVHLQLSDERNDLAAKSLCDLAKTAKGMGFLDSQLAWTIRAREVNPQDPWVHTQCADALLGHGDLLGALQVYEDAVRDFPENVVARTGKAEVLKALGRLPEALEAYGATVHDFPENVVARNGKAEVLKALGRLPEALEAYEATIQDFPENVRARTGKAEVLKALGRLPEALEAYEGTVRDFPENVVARTGKAEVLRVLGRLPEALDAYGATLRDFPGDVVVRNGMAEVLKALGRLPEALGTYEATVQDFPQNVVARNGKAEVLKALGRLLEALEAYGATVHDFPENVVARNGKAEVLKALGRLPEALDAYEGTVRDFPQNVVARTGKAEVLKALGRLPEALEAYDATLLDFSENLVARSGKAVLLVLQGRYAEAEALVNTPETRTQSEWVALHIRATIKLKQGAFEEADKLFSAGEQCPWVENRSRFIGSRAVLRIKTKRLKEAEAMIRSQSTLISKVIQIDVYRRMNRVSEAKSVLRELRDCGDAEIVRISHDLEQNMKPGRRTVSDNEFLDREIELLLAA